MIEFAESGEQVSITVLRNSIFVSRKSYIH